MVNTDRFDESARRAVALSRDEARRLGHGHVGTEHLLLGLVAEGGSGTARALVAAGAPLAACREKVGEALAQRPVVRPAGGQPEFTDRAARALDRAGKLSLRLKHERVETGHVLLSVLDVEGTAGQVLRGLAVDLSALRAAVSELLGGAEPPEAGVPTETGVPTEAGGRLDRPGRAPGGAADDGGPAVQDAPVGGATAEGSPSASAGGATAEGSASASAQAPPAAVRNLGPGCATCGAPLEGALSHAVVTTADGAVFDVAFCAACGAAVGATRI